jgi:hypothetical protein
MGRGDEAFVKVTLRRSSEVATASANDFTGY